MNRFLLSLAALTGVYLLVLASAAPWDVAIGVLLAAGLLLATRGLGAGGSIAHLGRRLLHLPAFLLAVFWDIVVGTWTVALIVLHLRPLRQPGIVAIPIGERTQFGVVVSTLASMLSPGTFLVDIDDERQLILMHVIDASDPDAIREQQHQFYQRFQRQVFP